MENALVHEGMAAVENKLLAVIDSEVDLLNDASKHILTSGGKRLRPQMTLLAYLAAGGQNLEEAVPMATAVEMVHTATLVHDDINDHSVMRRGRPAVHARWGRTFALLTGDYLFTKVYELMAPYGATYNVIMAEACSRLVEGETLQAAAAKAGNIDRETYKRIVSLKTASLFEAAARMGSLLAGGDEKVTNALADYAYNLGVAFQIVDDILDIVGDPEALGKPVGTDLQQARGVMVAQGGYGGRQTNGREAVAVVEEVVEPEPADPIEQMMRRLRDSGAVQLARLQADEVAGRARLALQEVPPSPARDYLDGLIDLVLERNR